MDDTVKHAKVWLEQLLSLMGFPTTVAIAKQSEKSLVMGPWLIIDEKKLSPAQVQTLLTDQGAPLDAIQYLLNAAIDSQGNSTGLATAETVTVELAGFRSKRQGELISLSEEAAKRVTDTHAPVEMETLSSSDRRQVHNYFKDSADFETESRGEGEQRRLVIRPRK